ncbi:MAG: polysaccharide deacetylase family protein [Pyrinomonadaceae bacterium]
MNRRQFTKTLGVSALAMKLGGVTFSAAKSGPQIAITMDDFNWANAVKLTADERNEAILGALESRTVKAALFVMGRNIDNDEGKRLLKPWNDAGHLIGNHTYSHRPYDNPAMQPATYGQDILRAEALLEQFPRFKKYFRFPLLKEGETAAKRNAMRKFLSEHGYRNGHVTIDNSDWIVDQRLTRRLKTNSSADIAPYRDFYLEHMWDRAQYYDLLARKVLGRPVRHTLLTHFNLLNGLFLGDLMDMFKSKGWQLIDAEEAFADPMFKAQPSVVPAGESIVWSLAKEKGTIAKSLRYPAEDGVYEEARMNKLGL